MKIGLFPMVGDLLHLGHLYSLKVAKSKCDFLIVALNTNPTIDNPQKNSPVETVYERWYRLSSCSYVDQIIPYCGEEDLLRLLKTTKYDIRFVGSDHITWTGKEYEEANFIEPVVIPRDHNESSSELRRRVEEQKRL